MSNHNLSLFDQKRKMHTVSEITHQVKELLAKSFRDLWITGEVSNLTYHRSGHVYFTLKDEGAALHCVMWRSSATKLKFRIEEGSEIIVLGNIGVYEARGNYQLVVVYAEPKGIGALALAFEQLKKKLEAEGLFGESHKNPLPFLPRRIGIITSPTGAAVRDIIRTIMANYPNAHVIIYPVRVQGEAAAGEIARALQTLDKINEVDVIIVGRGGGSLEDLWPFNEEVVARAIFACTIPIISAVGHEVDVTISDYVADARAATPTAAGEMVLPNEEDLRLSLLQLRHRLGLALRNTVERRKDGLNRIAASHIFRRPLDMVEQRSQQLDELWRNISREARFWLESRRDSLDATGSHLGSLNPLNVLTRGYSITTVANTKVPLKSTAGLATGQTIETVLSEGKIVSKIERVEEN